MRKSMAVLMMKRLHLLRQGRKREDLHNSVDDLIAFKRAIFDDSNVVIGEYAFTF